MSAPRPGVDDFGARLSFDRGAPGRRAVDVPSWNGDETPLPDSHLLRDSVRLPELSQSELVRYYTELSARNYGIDSGTYPLGSCTMKYNPKVNDLVALMPGFSRAHPQAPPEEVQGTLRTMLELRRGLGELTGLPHVSLAPAAGAHGELAGVLMVTHALEDRGDIDTRRRILVPDSAHGTNPATAAMAGYKVTQIPTAANGSMDRATIERELDETVAAVMVTAPNTLGLWEQGIEEVAELIHDAGAYLYGDGANFNAIMGRVRYGDLGFDVVHLNLHKSFSTPHGGGGPGAGPVCCSEELARYLPTPVVEEDDDGLVRLAAPERSIGLMQQFHGNAGVLIRAYAYMRALGLGGLRAVSGQAVLNANYMRALLHGHFDLPYDRPVLHEVVFSGSRQRREHGVPTYDIAKRLIDHGFHPPTVYFPLIVEEALMIEPTESEPPEAIEALAEAMIAVAEEAERDPDTLHHAPWTAPIGRLDEATAARRPVLRWQDGS
ncbi:MAG: aminomethyl-transferring glycine dehydrogenase subunit GcvPB [bacterium]|nr:aminomethyl-transferring glycine dehydrogenase subunit GcvPB [bacterium]MDE0287679.1 aminomethyl-transferring glycine dehydrogenase subunit GcvPB [bacterium]MDE0438192.1 aminomethyl-transferring glycine dehydrogenase subunit GcvPB [bacterium]